jgi:hypothetical protein
VRAHGARARLFSLRTAVILAACALAQVPSAEASDSSRGVTAPGLQTEPRGQVSAHGASVLLSGATVKLTLRLAVLPGEAARAIFATPPFHWLGEGDPYPDRQFPELQVRVAGKPAVLDDSFSAFVGSTDVSDAIRAAGVNPFAIADSPPVLTKADLDSAQLENLLRLGALKRDGDNYIAAWSARRIVTVELPAGKEQMLGVQYKSRPGFALLSVPEIAARVQLADYCLTKPQLRRALAAVAASKMVVIKEYAVPTGIDDSAPQELWAEIDAFDGGDHRQSIGLLCGADGSSVRVRIGHRLRVRADPRGVLHMLLLSDRSGR